MCNARPGWPRPLPARMADNARAWAKFERPKNACVFEGGRIWSSPHGRARASGPAALFALRAVFEAAVLIYGDVNDVLKLFAQKARDSRGRDPEEPPLGGGDAAPIRVLSDAAAAPARGHGGPRAMRV
jgi:hypothetical protein